MNSQTKPSPYQEHQMKNHRITIRLSEHNLGRALQAIRILDPTYKFTSTSSLVKTIFNDYLDKMNLALTEDVPAEIMEEILNFINQPVSERKTISLQDLIDLENDTEETIRQFKQPLPTKKPSNILNE